jgi:hypothetical protein
MPLTANGPKASIATEPRKLSSRSSTHIQGPHDLHTGLRVSRGVSAPTLNYASVALLLDLLGGSGSFAPQRQPRSGQAIVGGTPSAREAWWLAQFSATVVERIPVG